MTLSYSYVPDYFSLTDILCTEERISCKIEVTLPRLGKFIKILLYLFSIKIQTCLLVLNVYHYNKNSEIVLLFTDETFLRNILIN